MISVGESASAEVRGRFIKVRMRFPRMKPIIKIVLPRRPSGITVQVDAPQRRDRRRETELELDDHRCLASRLTLGIPALSTEQQIFALVHLEGQAAAGTVAAAGI